MEREIKPVTVQADGQPFDGFYAIQYDMLTVWHAHLGSRTAGVVASSVEEQIKTLLLEIFRDCRHRRIPYATSRR